MGIIDHILKVQKAAIWRHFSGLRKRSVPDIQTPVTPEEALKVGYRMGLQAGYGEGLIDGVGLGMDVNTTVAVSPVMSFPDFPNPMDIH